MKVLFFSLICFPFLVFSQDAKNITYGNNKNDKFKVDSARIDSVFKQFDRKDCPGCAVALMNAGNIIFEKGYGMANLEHSIPITPATVFDIASVSKQFTAFAIALLAREGKLSLDDNVRKFVPELPDFGKPVTIRHLVHHTSGLRDYGALLLTTGWRLDHPLDSTDFFEVISKQTALNFDPGEKFLYSNTNYALMGLIVERVSGRSFSQFMKSEVFDPLEMTTTIVRDNPLLPVPNRASNYTAVKDRGYMINYVWGFSKVMGPFSIHTTVQDLARWDSNFYQEKVGGKGISEMMYSPGILNSGQNSDYAYGLFTWIYRGLRVISHTGWGGGSFILMRFPDQKFSVAVLCNRYYTQTDAEMLALQVADIVLTDKYKDNQAGLPVIAKKAPPKEEIEKYSGVYWKEGSPDRISFVVHNGILTCRKNAGKQFPLAYISKGRFFDKEEELVYAFKTTGKGIVSVEMTVPGTIGSEKAERRQSANPTPDQLQQYVGEYNSNELDLVWSFYVKDGKLLVRRKKFEDSILEPVYADGFSFNYADDTGNFRYLVNFKRAEDGTINKFTVTSGRLVGIVFNRVNH